MYRVEIFQVSKAKSKERAELNKQQTYRHTFVRL